MKFLGFTCTYNEEKMIPYVMPYVERMGYDKFIVYDNESTDNTVELLKQYPFVEVRSYSTNGVFDETKRQKLFMESYLEAIEYTKDDLVWMTWTDFDEVIYSNYGGNNMRMILEYATSEGYAVYDGDMVNLISEVFPSIKDGELVHKKIRRCSYWQRGKKATLFMVNGLTSLFTSPGFHMTDFEYENKNLKFFGNERSLFSFHLKYLSHDYRANKNSHHNDRYGREEYGDFDETWTNLMLTSFPMEEYYKSKALNPNGLTILAGSKFL